MNETIMMNGTTIMQQNTELTMILVALLILTLVLLTTTLFLEQRNRRMTNFLTEQKLLGKFHEYNAEISRKA